MKSNGLKKACTALLAAGMVAVSVPAQAGGIPVFDGAASAQRQTNFIQQIAEMGKQLAQMKNQYEQQVKQFKSMTGSRNMGNVLRDTVKDQLPSEWSDIYKQAKNIDYKSEINAKSYDSEQMDKNLLKNQKSLQESFAKVEKQFVNLQTLLDQVNLTQDMKAATDLQNRISVQQATIQTTQMKLDMMDRLYARQQEIEQRRYQAREACMARHIVDKKFSECGK